MYEIDYNFAIQMYIIYIKEVNSQTKYEFYIFIETLQIVSSMCSHQMSMQNPITFNFWAKGGIISVQ